MSRARGSGHDGVGRPRTGAQFELRPPMAHHELLRLLAGQPDIAIERVDAALRLSPWATLP
jgi:hypothetical protein